MCCDFFKKNFSYIASATFFLGNIASTTIQTTKPMRALVCIHTNWPVMAHTYIGIAHPPLLCEVACRHKAYRNVYFDTSEQ